MKFPWLGIGLGLLLWAAILAAAFPAFAQRSIGGANITPVFVGTVSGGPTAYTSTPALPSGFTATAYYQFCGQFSTNNTAASTLNVGSTSAIPINRMTALGPVALSGGEIIGSPTPQNYCFQLNSGATAWIMQTQSPGSLTILSTGSPNHNVTQAEWANGQVFLVTAASQTITVPVVTTLGGGGGILIETVGQSVSLVPNSADGINGNTINTPQTILANTVSAVGTTGSSGINALQANLGVSPSSGLSGMTATQIPVAATATTVTSSLPTSGTSGVTQVATATSASKTAGHTVQYDANANLVDGGTLSKSISWGPGQNLSTQPISFFTADVARTITAITCRVDTAEGGTATIDVRTAASGTALGSGTDQTSTPCNANGTANTNQASLLTGAGTMAAGTSVGIVGTGFGTTNGSGSLTVYYK